MIFLTIFGVTDIFCSFRLVLEGKTGKEIPESSRLEFLEKFSANNFALSDAEDNTSGPLNRGGIADLPLLRTLLAIHQKSWEPSFWEVMESFVLLAYASLAASRTILQWLLACLNFMAAAQAAENRGHEWELTWFFWWGIYTSIPKRTHSQSSRAVGEALSLRISSQGKSLKWAWRSSQF